jgi:prepilin-type N-terminal cleavage/methylation domain-containing protein
MKAFIKLFQSRTGFTLIELMIIIAIIGILASAAIPQWRRYTQNTELRTAARTIANDIFNMKQRASGENAEYRITFDEAGNRYQIINADTGLVLQTKDLADFGTGIVITNAAFQFGDVINFGARGSADPGSIRLQNGIGSTATITVNFTGRTHVSFDIK